MLPLNSPADSFRAGYWAVRRNPGVIIAFVALTIVHDRIFWAFRDEVAIESAGVAAVFLV